MIISYYILTIMYLSETAFNIVLLGYVLIHVHICNIFHFGDAWDKIKV